MESHPWKHPGGKLMDKGAQALTEGELLAILIGAGIPGRSAEQIAKEMLARFGSFKGMAGQPIERFLTIKGLGEVKMVRVAAAFEIARRWVDIVIKEMKSDPIMRRETLGD